MDPVPHLIFPQDSVPLQHIKELGRGGFAIVDKVHPKAEYIEGLGHTSKGQVYARKVLKVSRKQSLSEILQEIQVFKSLRHYHIVEVKLTYEETIEAEWHKQTFGVVMHPVADCTLEEYLHALESKIKRVRTENYTDPSQLSEDISRGIFNIERWFGCLASGLAYIHSKRIRHKDIKPANVLVWNDCVLYTDFGISHAIEESDPTTKTTGPPGARTEMYCAPEIAASQPRGRKADVFSLGCVYAEMLVVFCGVPMQSFAEWRGLKGEQAYHKSLENTLRWLFHIQPRAAGYQHYCCAALIPDPELRVSSDDLKCWISVDRDHISGWNGSRACSCMGSTAVGEFWTASLEGRPPYHSALDKNVDISWETAIESWIARTKWKQERRGKPPIILEFKPPSLMPDCLIDPKPFFEIPD